MLHLTLGNEAVPTGCVAHDLRATALSEPKGDKGIFIGAPSRKRECHAIASEGSSQKRIHYDNVVLRGANCNIVAFTSGLWHNIVCDRRFSSDFAG